MPQSRIRMRQHWGNFWLSLSMVSETLVKIRRRIAWNGLLLNASHIIRVSRSVAYYLSGHWFIESVVERRVFLDCSILSFKHDLAQTDSVFYALTSRLGSANSGNGGLWNGYISDRLGRAEGCHMDISSVTTWLSAERRNDDARSHKLKWPNITVTISTQNIQLYENVRIRDLATTAHRWILYIRI